LFDILQVIPLIVPDPVV